MSDEEFETKLQRLVAEAREEGVQVLGAYDVRSPDREQHDFQIEITEIQKRTPGWMYSDE